jgi:hypothetical protein
MSAASVAAGSATAEAVSAVAGSAAATVKAAAVTRLRTARHQLVINGEEKPGLVN